MLEMVVLALIGAAGVVGHARSIAITWPIVLVWLHLALTSIRNAPLFALAAAPALAAPPRRPASLGSLEAGRSRAGSRVWIPAIVGDGARTAVIAGVPLG